MIFYPFVLLLFLVVAEETLTYSPWRHPSFLRSFTTFSPVRSFTTSLNASSSGSPNILNQLKRLELKIDVVEYCLDNFVSDDKPKIDDKGFHKMVQRYEGSEKEYLRGMLKDLQREKSALQEKETAFIISKATVENKGPVPRLVDDFSAVWTAIVNHPIVENPKNPRLWSLHGGIKWIGGVQELYNRPCYDEITEDISSLTHALVIGTPGIGKTLYLQVFLVHLFTRAKAEGRDIPTIHYVYETKKKVITLSFLSDGTVFDITDVGRVPDPEYLLSDNVDLNAPYGTLLNLLVASDKSRNYNDFEKRIGEPGALRGETIIMPLWSFDELICIRPDTMDLELAQFHYHVYGGSARNFMFMKHVRSRVLPVVEDTMNLMFRHAKIDELYPDEWSNIARRISSRLTSEDDANSANPSTLNSMLQHLLPDRKKIWASKFMELLAGAIFEDRSNDISAELRRLIRSSGEGNLFESLGHRKLLKSQIPFTLKPLLDPLPDDKPIFPSVQFNLSAIMFNTISEITHLPDGTYALPATSNFPVVDAIVQPNMTIQFTISPTGHIGAVKNLADICAGLHEKDLTKVKFVFVIPKDNVASFRGEESLVVSNIAIPQYICLDDPSVGNGTTLMTTREKQKWTQKWVYKKTNGYLLFLKDFRAKLQSNDPEMPAVAVTSKLVKIWSSLSPEDKENWGRMAKEQNEKMDAEYAKETGIIDNHN